MEYFNGTLCIEAEWLIDNGIFSKSNYDALKRRGKINVVRRACYSITALISYESIPERFQRAVRELLGGDPKEMAPSSTLADFVVEDEAARTFYRDHLIDTDDHLPIEVQREYCTNAEILNAIHRIINDREAEAKVRGGRLSKKGIWPILAVAVLKLDKTAFKHSLPPHAKFDADGKMIPLTPQAYRRLQDAYNKYKATTSGKYKRIGYESLIHGNWCNTNSEKINEAAKVWLIGKWSNNVQRIANEQQLLQEYNFLAESMGWKQLKKVDTIHNFLHQPEIKTLWYSHRFGELKAKEKYVMQHKTILPTMRDSLWYSDGTKLNYFYQYRDEKGRFKMGTTSVYEVLDVYSECLLGYHISDTENYEAQYNGFRMALQTSGQKPYEIRYDNQGGHKKLEAGCFLNNLSHLSIRTKPYNGKSKTIESVFGRFQMQVLKKDWFFTGQNVVVKRDESKANMEFIMANKHNLPTLSEIHETYKKRRQEWMNMQHPTSSLTRIETYRQSENPRAVKLEIMDMVELFWITRPKPVQCTAYGISFDEKKERHDYMVNDVNGLPDVRWLAKNIDRKFRIKFDPNDDSLIYLYEDTPQGLRFVIEAFKKVEIHRGIQEKEDWEAEWYAKVEAASREVREENFNVALEYQRQIGLHPEQHGMNVPNIKGNGGSKRKKTKATGGTDNFGKLQKVLSNVVADGADLDENSIYDHM